jgi:nitroreductase
MNETIKSIMERRSCRAYRPETINDKELSAILDAARYAPSARNLQPWHFSVITNKSLLDRITDGCREAMRASGDPDRIKMAANPAFTTFYHAPLVIIVSGDSGNTFANGDCANAVENMALAAHSLGIGSCIIASFRAALSQPCGGEIKKELCVPEGYTPFFALSLGYPAAPCQGPAPRREGTVNYVK